MTDTDFASIKLNANQVASLREAAPKAENVSFWWRQASMKSMIPLGLVEAWSSDGVIRKRPAHRLTAKGREYLAWLDART